jgi:Domain of unknown function DUF11
MWRGRYRAGTLAALIAVAASAALAPSASAAVTIHTDPELASPAPGTDLTYVVDGPATTAIPAGTSVVGTGDGCVAVEAAVTCSQPSTFTVRVPSDMPPGSTLTAVATDGIDSSSATTTVAPGLADLSTSVSPLAAGGLVTWQVGLHNAGPSDADSPHVAMPIPPGTPFIAAMQLSGPSFTCTHDSANIACTRDHLPAGDDARFEFVLAAVPGSMRGQPLASALTTDPDHTNDGSDATVDIAAPDPLPVPSPLPTPDPAAAPQQVITLGNAVEGAGSGAIFVPVGCMNETLGFCRTTVTVRFAKPHQKLKPIVRRLQIASGQTSVAFMAGSLAQRRKIRVVRHLRITVTATNPPGPPVKRSSMLSGHPRPRR